MGNGNLKWIVFACYRHWRKKIPCVLIIDQTLMWPNRIYVNDMNNEHYSQDLLVFLRRMATSQLVFFVCWGTHKMKTKDSPQFSGTITDAIVSCGLELTLSRGYLRDRPFIIWVSVLKMQILSIICSKEKPK